LAEATTELVDIIWSQVGHDYASQATANFAKYRVCTVYGKPLGRSRKNPFHTLIFLIDTFAKQFVDSLVIAVHTNLLAIE